MRYEPKDHKSSDGPATTSPEPSIDDRPTTSQQAEPLAIGRQVVLGRESKRK